MALSHAQHFNQTEGLSLATRALLHILQHGTEAHVVRLSRRFLRAGSIARLRRRRCPP
jgi:hypothetical protein